MSDEPTWEYFVRTYTQPSREVIEGLAKSLTSTDGPVRITVEVWRKGPS